MNSISKRNVRRIATLGLAGLAMAGCEQPHSSKKSGSAGVAWFGGKSDTMVSSNIVAVRKFFSNSPWLIFNGNGTGRIDGVKMAVYLEAADRPKGVFGTGTLMVTMYRIDHDPTGREVTSQIYEWEFPSEKAYFWRSKNETTLGWGYGLRLNWGSKLNVAGRDVAFVVRYLREDGGQVRSSRQILRVPNVGSPPGPDEVS